MSGDIGLEQPIIFYDEEITETKKVVLKHKGIKLAYLEINSQKVNDSLKRQRSLDKTL